MPDERARYSDSVMDEKIREAFLPTPLQKARADLGTAQDEERHALEWLGRAALDHGETTIFFIQQKQEARAARKRVIEASNLCSAFDDEERRAS